MEPVTVRGNIEFSVVSVDAEKAVSEMPVQSGILNPYGVVHAGAILWLADVTATILALGAATAEVGMAGFPLAITLNANLAANQKSGILRAIATFVKKGKTVTIVRTIVSGDGDKLIADVTTNHIAAK